MVRKEDCPKNPQRGKEPPVGAGRKCGVCGRHNRIRVYIRRRKSFVFLSPMRECNHPHQPDVGNSVIAPAAARIRIIHPRLAAILPSATSWEFWDGAAGDLQCKAYEEFALVLRDGNDMDLSAFRASDLWHPTRERSLAEASLQCRAYPIRLTVQRVSGICTNLRR
jgi:hypothetical protein